MKKEIQTSITMRFRDVRHAIEGCLKGTTITRQFSRISFRSASVWDADGFANLPTDCIVAIVEAFVDKNEAAVMREVCRSWRDGFDQTVKCVAIHNNMMLLPASQASNFPSLQHLVVSHISNTAVAAAVKLVGIPSSNITILELSHNMMHTAPPDLHRLTGLKTLVMSSNRLKTLVRTKIHLLPQLEHLDLSGNLLTELPASIGSLGGTLRKLNVSENQLSYLPEGLGGLTGLQTLRASNNTLLELPDSLVQLQALTCLDLSLNRLKNLPDNFTRLTNLHHLGLFASFSHSLRNEGSSTVKVLACLTIDHPDMHLHAEELLLSLVRIRKRQLRQAAEAAEAAHAAE